MHRQLGPEERILVRRDGRRRTRMAFGFQRALPLVLLQVPFDGGEADSEIAGGRALRPPRLDRRHNLASYVQGICFHFVVCQLDQLPRKML